MILWETKLTHNIPILEQPKRIISKFEKQVEIILEQNVPVFSFVFGIPSKEILLECKKETSKLLELPLLLMKL